MAGYIAVTQVFQAFMVGCLMACKPRPSRPGRDGCLPTCTPTHSFLTFPSPAAWLLGQGYAAWLLAQGYAAWLLYAHPAPPPPLPPSLPPSPQVMAPFTPFLTEAMYQNLRRSLPEDSLQASRGEGGGRFWWGENAEGREGKAGGSIA